MMHNRAYRRASKYLHGWSKRCFDIAVCLVLLPPAVIVMAGAGLMILVRDGRPILFVQSRVGKNGVLFRMPKLRTLRANAQTRAPSTEHNRSSHITPTGRLLRKYKLDELPQLFTVLTGPMSLVGPRPELPDIVATYSSFQRQRLLMRPGLTGPWQVLANHKTPIHRYLKYDLYYLRKASLWLDLKLLVLTIPSIVKPQGRDRA
jgi:lipopolysaccharide/colanic/teichoic acid biosynthesis glycosyltransferase